MKKIDFFKEEPKKKSKSNENFSKDMKNLLIGTGAVILGIKGVQMLGDL